MKMTTTELQAFYRRVVNAAARGYSVAHGDAYASVLAKESGLSGYDGSAKDLVVLSRAALAKRGGQSQPASSKKTPSAQVIVEEDHYASWTKDELYEEAQIREIAGRSEMNKADLVAALEAHDLKPET